MKDIFQIFDTPKDLPNYNSVQISLASPERIREWSFGEVKKPETINYRTFKPERDGLFCAKIFGPIKDYECLCGKYKRMKHRGVTCERCGVQVIQARVRRERLGHINLATPVAHVWFLHSLPSRIGNLLDLPLKELEKVLYCVSYVVLDPKETTLLKGEILSEQKYQTYIDEFGWDSFRAGMGAEAIRELLRDINIDELSEVLRIEMREAGSEAKRKKIAKRLKVVEAFRSSQNEPEWMVLEVIPVLPPDLRPLVPLDGGRFATSDLNDLYRRVINRNNRLQRLKELGAPEIIIRNEKRMLQEAVDALFDNGKRGKVITGPNKRPLKSLSDMLRGKQGRFRQNLLGKRVDYSGRSVIVAGPELKLHQCGLPKKMALELFKPFIFHKLEKRGIVTTIKSARKKVESESDEVWEILEEVVKEHPVLLNRAPTLHRLGIQAFEPVLIEGKAIQLHPLVCTAYNADFDGDQMAVHVPLSIEAQVESRVLLLSTNNILSPANGKPIISPSQDIVLGCYWMTRDRPHAKGEGRVFSDESELRAAYDNGIVDLQARVKCRVRGKLEDTTPGRVIFSEILPDELSFDLVNKTLKKKDLGVLIDEAYRFAGEKGTVLFADKMRTLGYTFSTVAGITVGLHDMIIPSSKWDLVDDAKRQVQEVDEERRKGGLTERERYNRVVDIWAIVTEEIAKRMMSEIKTQRFTNEDGETIESESFNSIYIMADSGARGSAQQMRQLSGMRGLMAKPSGEIIETPIQANFREGLSGLEYFISTHGARKGLADTALKTANSGYMTRRLVDVAQDAIISEMDCGTAEGLEVTALVENGEIVQPLSERIVGRVTLEPIYDATDELVVDAGVEIDDDVCERLDRARIDKVLVRSPMTCQAQRGLCANCYGRDLARGRMVNVGEAVGIIAAQSIGEPGTQLTMRTFHAGGVATGSAEQGSIECKTSGVVKYEDVRRISVEGGAWVTINKGGKIHICDAQGFVKETFTLAYGARLPFDEGQDAVAGARLAQWDVYNDPIIALKDGIVRFEDIIDGVTADETTDQMSGLSRRVILEAKDQTLRPRIVLRDLESNKVLATYQLSPNTILEIEEKTQVKAGHVLAKRPRETQKTRDITGGLPRVNELFEARKPKDPAIVSEITGTVQFTRETKGKRFLEVVPEMGEKRKYAIPKGRQIIVQEGDYVRAGEALTDGLENPHSILQISGRQALINYLTDEIQQVYRRQGVRIHDKHIEVIVRQMLRRVRVTDVGDTAFLVDQQVDRAIFEKENQRVVTEGKRPAHGEDLLLGITKAALATDSWISAASFQETTKVLTEAAINGRVDYLAGLKENVIMGRLIPAGTGLNAYRQLEVRMTPEADGFEDEDDDFAIAE